MRLSSVLGSRELERHICGKIIGIPYAYKCGID